MTTAQMLFFAIVFASATMAAMIVLTQLASSRTRKRLKTIGGDAAFGERGDAAGWLSTAIKLSGPFAKLSIPEVGWEQSPLRLRFMNAGYRGEGARVLYFGAKTLLAVGLPLIAFVVVKLAAPALAAPLLMTVLLLVSAFGYYLPNVVLARLTFFRQRSIFENFPDAADLLLVCVEAGLGLDAGLNRVAEEISLKSKALAEELQLVNLEMRAGNTREKSLHNLALRTGVDEVNTFATMLVQADRFGTSVGDSLRVFSDEMRGRRRFRAEELASKIPLKLLFPLVFFVFPSLLTVLLGPAFIQVYRVLMPTLTGH
ncbi:MAG: type II secretion system F family protein [Rhodocyclaceae bacterium]|nr:type II secretion system F family protein [Rhodocyclaceae bacterium]